MQQTPGLASDARERFACLARIPHTPYPGSQATGADSEPAATAIYGVQAERGLGNRHHLNTDLAGLALSCRGDGFVLKEDKE